MNKLIIVADSTIDLPKDFAEANGIKIFPLTVNFPNASYQDGVDITTKQLYQIIAEKKQLPHTAAITPGEIYKIFNRFINEEYDIIFTGIGAKFSKSYENALMMSQEFPAGRIEVVDSQNLSTGTALLIMKAVKWRDEGYNVHEIAEKMRETAKLVKSQFVIETMEFLHKGGRCSSLARLFGTMLKIKPIIEVRNGVMNVGSKPRGKMKVALDKLLEMLEADGDNVDPDYIFVTHSEADESAQYLLPLVQKLHPNAKVMETNAGCVISTHCGPGTIGILWLNKE